MIFKFIRVLVLQHFMYAHFLFQHLSDFVYIHLFLNGMEKLSKYTHRAYIEISIHNCTEKRKHARIRSRKMHSKADMDYGLLANNPQAACSLVNTSVLTLTLSAQYALRFPQMFRRFCLFKEKDYVIYEHYITEMTATICFSIKTC